MKIYFRCYWLITLILGIFPPLPAFGHGGSVQMQKTAGPFQVTVFSEPGVLRAGPVDLSVLVQRSQRSDPILDAIVTLGLFPMDRNQSTRAWEPPYCAMDKSQSLSRLNGVRAGAGNQLLYEALAKIPYQGKWLLRVVVKQGDATGEAETLVEVAPPAPPWATYWPLFAFPPLAIAGFCLQRKIKGVKD